MVSTKTLLLKHYYRHKGFRGFCRRIFLILWEKCPEKSSRKIPGKILQNLYNKIPDTFLQRGLANNCDFFILIPLRPQTVARLFRGLNLRADLTEIGCYCVLRLANAGDCDCFLWSRSNRKGGTASLRPHMCVKRNAGFGGRFRGLSLYHAGRKSVSQVLFRKGMI